MKMFKKIAIALLIASATYGNPVKSAKTAGSTGVESQTYNTAATDVNQTYNAATDAYTANTVNAAPATNGSRFTEAELAAASPAPIHQICQQPGQFVITFDDGPNPETTPRALEYLRSKNIKAAFFINGINYGDVENSQATIDLIRQEYNEGHDIGSHTYYHKDLFDAIKEGTMELNIDKMTDKIEEIIGVKPAFFRPPNGNGAYTETDPERKEYNDRVQKYLGASGYNIIMWGTDTRDWSFKNDADKVEKAIGELNRQLTAPGVSPQTHSFITLMHDVHDSTVDTILPAVVEYVSSLGYQFVSLTECLGISAYQSQPAALYDGYNLNADNVDPNTNAVDGTEQVEDVSERSSASSIENKMIYLTLSVILSLFFLL